LERPGRARGGAGVLHVVVKIEVAVVVRDEGAEILDRLLLGASVDEADKSDGEGSGGKKEEGAAHALESTRTPGPSTTVLRAGDLKLRVRSRDHEGVVVPGDGEHPPADELELERERRGVVEARLGGQDGQVRAPEAPPARAVLEERAVQILRGARAVVQDREAEADKVVRRFAAVGEVVPVEVPAGLLGGDL